MLGLAKLNPACCASASKTAPLLPFITAFALEFFINGIVIVLSALASQFVALTTALSLSLCCFICGLTITTRLLARNFATVPTMISVLLMALLFPLGGILAFLLLLPMTTSWIQVMLAFSIGVLLYITTTDLLMNGLKPKSHWPMVVFYLGFLLILLLRSILGG